MKTGQRKVDAEMGGGGKISTVKEEMGGGRAFGGVVGPRL